MAECQVTQQCRVCDNPVAEPFLDFGLMPIANDWQAEPGADCRRFPLAVWECPNCHLVQLSHVVAPDILFRNYGYVVSCSPPMVAHMETLASRFAHPKAKIVDIGGNDGTLAAAFIRRGSTAIVIDPAENIPCKAPKINRLLDRVAVAEAIELLDGKPDIVTATNVCAHVDDLVGFLKLVGGLLAPGGIFVTEWPDWRRTADLGAFDIIYHEHLSYFTFESFAYALRRAGLIPIQSEAVPVQGGSLLIISRRARAHEAIELPSRNGAAGSFMAMARATMKELPAFLESWQGRIAGYGAPAKATTLVNAVGIDESLLPYTVDSTPSKIGRYIPGTSIPIKAESELGNPECALILAWNFANDIRRKLPEGIQAAVPIPIPRVLSGGPSDKW